MVELRRDWTEVVVSMQREVERFIGDFASRKPPSVRFSPRAWAPAVDVYETLDEVVVIVELAGVKQEEIEIEVHGKLLVVRGERRDIKQGVRRSYSQIEIMWGPFERNIALPSAVNVAETKAYYDDGILEIVLPKLDMQTGYKVEIKDS